LGYTNVLASWIFENTRVLGCDLLALRAVWMHMLKGGTRN